MEETALDATSRFGALARVETYTRDKTSLKAVGH